MKLVLVLTVGLGVMLLMMFLRGAFSGKSAPKNEVSRLERSQIPWVSIGILRIVRGLAGVLAVVIVLLVLKRLLAGFVEISDVNSTRGAWLVALKICLLLMPSTALFGVSGMIRKKVNLLYQKATHSRNLLIASRWSF